MLKRLSYPLAWMETLTGEKEEEKSSQPSSADSHHASVFSKVFSRFVNMCKEKPLSPPLI